MNVRLQELSAEEYARSVLPETHALWGNARTLDEYVEETLALAAAPYGRRFYRTFALKNSAAVISSFKRYERAARVGRERLRAFGLGAIFTQPQYRGRGFASAMIGLALDVARSAGMDLVYLFSDIHPHFYEQLGFRELPSRSISMRADALEGGRVGARALTQRDWPGIRACFERCEAARSFAFTRSPLVWDWVRARMATRARSPHAQPVYLVKEAGRVVDAYVFGYREPVHDAYVLDECCYATPEGRLAIEPMLRSAAGDLRRVVGWLPPVPVRMLLPRGSVRRRADAIFMAAALTGAGERFVELGATRSPADGVWSFDHV